MEQQNRMGTAKMGPLIFSMALPAMISMIINALYNIVDQIFIANAPYLGSYGNSANTVVYPLTVVALAFAVLIGDGCCAYVSISLGAGRGEEAEKSVTNAIILSLAVSAVLTAVCIALGVCGGTLIINALGGLLL